MKHSPFILNSSPTVTRRSPISSKLVKVHLVYLAMLRFKDIKYAIPFGLLFYLLSCGLGLTAQEDPFRSITGFILNVQGKAIPYVNVFLKDTYVGDVSDSAGRFEISTKKRGTFTLIASIIGYEQSTRKINLGKSDIGPLTIILREKTIAMPEAVITASSFSSGDEKGVTLKRMDVLTTPGAAADIFLAIKTFPGLAHIDEGSGLFVRGGDVSETVTILDQATVVHPYRFESPTGGTFGTITPFLLSGTFFSSGGFSAKYGNALSGILDMQSLDMPLQSQVNLNLGLAGASVGVALPINKKIGVRFSGNRSSTGLMFRVNGRYSEFTKHPGGADANFSLNYDYSETGRLKFFAFAAESEIGVKVDQPSFDGVFNSDDANQLYNLQWSELLSKNWYVRASLSLNIFHTDRSFGVLDLAQKDQTYKLRFDSEREFSPKFKINFGAEHELTRNRFQGRFPETDALDPNAEFTAIDEKYNAVRTGGYVESEIQLHRGLFAKTGLRVDHNNLAGQTALDPRASLFYQLSSDSNLRLSWGIYHQFPAPLFYSQDYGNPNLRVQKAVHYILGYEYWLDDMQIRAEVYYKDYDRLVLENDELEFINNGHGYARGLDLFFKRGVLFKDKLNGWISYSFLQSKRLQTHETEAGLAEEFASSSFDITHNLTVVAKYGVTDRLSTGLTYRFATGRPFTPVTRAVRDPEFNFYIPFEGPVNSERLPDFHRLDFSVSYLYPLKGSNFAVFYFGLSNVLNRKNVLGYDYSLDYSERTPRETNFSRFVYFGATVTFR
ncbi:MAG: TonB-dependent receptor domain-containing protein [bacterium]